ncbi:uncharacterized protein [Littorina saxatilis]|uniref:Fibronectin type III-like domain-containing protein n=1 Tax=Littorina saxatilis TaxID=31220 RepID=A0AAN9BMP1_9CAEN
MTSTWLYGTALLCMVFPTAHQSNSFRSWRSQSITKGDYPFLNASLPWAERVDDLVARLTLEEIQVQLSSGGGAPAPAIPRLGIGPYQWFSNCGRGDVGAPGNATAFPQAIGLAAAFSPDLRFRVAQATSIEQRAKHNDFVKQGLYSVHTGLSCFSPNIDLLRDPRWGRNQETPGEDPYMSGVHAQQFVRGIQGDHPRYVRVSAACKHFTAYGGPENIPVSRKSFNAEVSMRDLRMSFLPQYRMCVEAGTYSIYTTFNAINGVPAVGNKWLLTDVLRNEWNFTGYVSSESGAIENALKSFHYANNTVDIAAVCFNAGCNLDFPGGEKHPAYMSLVDAVKQGKVKESFVREQAKALFNTRMRLGEFDPPEMNPYTQIDPEAVVESAEHQALALEATLKSFVLLKNDGVLPFSKPWDTIGVVGPMANDTHQLTGDYSANTDPSYVTSPLDGLRKLTSVVQFASGCDSNVCNNYNSAAVRNTVTGTQVNFVVLGTGQSIEAEGHDRPDMEFAGHQKQVLLDTLETAPNTPLVLLLYSASPVNITTFADDPRVRAIVQGFLPAQAAGTALTHLLLNDLPGAVPAGRLPYTWPALASQIPPMVNYSMAGRTYRYFQGDPLYPFGYGLSYVTFTYLGLRYDKVVQAGHNMTGAVSLTNHGHVEADEAVQVYISWTDKLLPAPKLQLAWFDRVTIKSRDTIHVNFTVDARQMALWFYDGWEVRAGDMMLYVGGQQPNQKRQVPSNVIAGRFTIQGSMYMGKY